MIVGAYHVMVVPVADLAVEQNWHMAGMRGTGSRHLVADGLLAPARQTAPAAPPQDRLFFAVCTLATVAGATQGALNVVEDMFASDRKPFMTGYARLGESPGRLLDLRGASGFRTTSALRRHWRHVAVGSRHPLLNSCLAAEDLGAALVS
ncbi:hypothetical protein ACWDA3_47120 [Nonomuraea rubra]